MDTNSLNNLCTSWLSSIMDNVNTSLQSLQYNNSIINRKKQAQYLMVQSQLIRILLNVKSGKTKLQGYNHKMIKTGL